MKRNYMQFCVELTNHCNFKCVYCPHSLYGEEDTPSGSVFTRRKGFMDPDIFRKTISEAQTWAKSYSMGFFGEQQMHPKFDELIQGVPKWKDRNFHFSLNTNWSLVTKETIETLKCFDQIRISIDASTKEVWEALCPGSDLLTKDGVKGEGRYETLIEKIKWFLKLQDRPKVLLIYVRQTANKEDEAVFRNEWKHYLRPTDTLVTKAILTFGGVVFDPYMQENECHVVKENRFTVAWDGRCTPCSLDVNIAMHAGSLKDQSVEEIVSSSKWAGRLQGIRDRAGICANCFDGQNYGGRQTKGTSKG
jgi:sulfatase maturation enzyme AslB (radical SAM superfamily)